MVVMEDQKLPDPESYSIPEDMIDSVCKRGQGHECCRYLTFGGGRFCCSKNVMPIKRLLDIRVADQDMNARGDNCEGIGDLDDRDGVISTLEDVLRANV